MTSTVGPSSVESRIVFALRQAVLLVLCLLVGGALVARLRPDEAVERGMVSTPFLWAAALWLIVLIFHAIAFEKSQMSRLEREPLMLAVAVGVVMFAIGVMSFSAGDAGRRILYLATNALGTILFWWAVFSLARLFWLTISPPTEPTP